MTRQFQQLNYNTFNGGIITEASPLTFPDGASIDESNFELTKLGTRERRKGLDVVSKSTPLSKAVLATDKMVTYLWENTGRLDETFLVVAAENSIYIYDVQNSIPGDDLLYKTEVQKPDTTTFSFASNGGSLIIASGASTVTYINYLGNRLFSESAERLEIRDRTGIPNYTRNDDVDALKQDLRYAARGNYRPLNSDIYALNPIDSLPGTDPIPPSTTTFDFTTKRLIDDAKTVGASVVTKNELFTDAEYPSFMGYPVSSFILEKVTLAGADTNKLYVIFKDEFFISKVASNIGINSEIAKEDGTVYSAEVSDVHYTSLLSLAASLVLTEVNTSFHPHLYNLWNQGWGERRMGSTGSSLKAPIPYFADQVATPHRLPSMCDGVNYALYPNSAETSNRTAKRFHPKDLEANPPGTLTAPRGKYVIDALERGQGRYDQWRQDMVDKTETPPAEAFNHERTTGGPQAVAQYAGRAWYAGFTGDTSGSTIPLSNKILYSQTDDTALNACYQESDPTSDEEYAVLESDGGWVNIDGIDRVVKLLVVDTSLLVFGTNGVWVISSTDGNMFSPLASMVTKLSTKGAVNAPGIVQVDKDVYYWAEDSLYKITSGGFGQFGLETLTKATIHSMIEDLSEEDFNNISGMYDERQERILWIIDGQIGSPTRRVLAYNLLYTSFTINTLNRGVKANGQTFEPIALVEVPGFTPSTVSVNIVAGGFNVVAGNDNVDISFTRRSGQDTTVTYLTLIKETDGSNSLAFSSTFRDDFKDWGEVDAEAYLVTGYVSGGDSARQKDVPVLTVHFTKTETTAELKGVLNESGCLVQSHWDWTNDAYSNKWGTPFQAYRLPRPQIRGLGEEVAQGITVVTSKSKLRGRGKVLSLKFASEPEKDCKVLGWSMIMGANGNV